MAVKSINVDGIGLVDFYKRRGMRSIRISISGSQVRVSLPYWVPYNTAIKFAESKKEWVNNHQFARIHLLKNGEAIGKAHHLYFEINAVDSPKVKLKSTDIVVSCPVGENINSNHIQNLAIKACIKALRKEAQSLLPQRIKNIANIYGFSYRTLKIRQLKSRWGSCSQSNDIVLNLFLMQLPWDLIDYVILHELIHTKVHHHGRKFWDEFLVYEPNVKLLKKRIRSYHPSI